MIAADPNDHACLPSGGTRFGSGAGVLRGAGGGLGDYFLKCIFRDLDELEQFAGIHEIVHGYHRTISKKFPFAIYYLVRGDTLEIHAILGCRRDPAWGERRLEP